MKEFKQVPNNHTFESNIRRREAVDEKLGAREVIDTMFRRESLCEGADGWTLHVIWQAGTRLAVK